MAQLQARARLRADRLRQQRFAQERQAALIDSAMRTPLYWLQNHTKTENKHWKEEGLEPYAAFPRWPYFEAVFAVYENEPVVFQKKSRDMMMTWALIGFCVYKCMRLPSQQTLFQTKKEDDVEEMIHNAKILYDQMPAFLKEAHPLPKPLWRQGVREFDLGRGSVIEGVPGGGNQVRSKHPTRVVLDEAAFMPDAGESFSNCINASASQVFVNSSVAPGWFVDYADDTFTLAGGA